MVDIVCQSARKAREAVMIHQMLEKAGESVKLGIRDNVLSFAAEVAATTAYKFTDPPVPDDFIIPAGMEELKDVMDVSVPSIPLTPSVVRLFSCLYPEDTVRFNRCINGSQCQVYTMATTSPEHPVYPTTLPPPIALVDIETINTQLMAGHPVIGVDGECLFCHLTTCISSFLCKRPIPPKVRQPYHGFEASSVQCNDVMGIPVPHIDLHDYRVNLNCPIPVVESPMLAEIQTSTEYMCDLRAACSNPHHVTRMGLKTVLVDTPHEVYTAIWRPSGIFHRMYCRGVPPLAHDMDRFVDFVNLIASTPAFNDAMYTLFDAKWELTVRHVQNDFDYIDMMEELRQHGKTILPHVPATVVRYTLPRGTNRPWGVVARDTIQMCTSCGFLMAGVRVMELAGGTMTACSSDMMKPVNGRSKRGSAAERKTFHSTRCGKLVDSQAVYAYISLVPGGRSLGVTLCVCGRRTVMNASYFTGTHWQCVHCVQMKYKILYAKLSYRGQRHLGKYVIRTRPRCSQCGRSTDRRKEFHNAIFRVVQNGDKQTIDVLCGDCNFNPRETCQNPQQSFHGVP